MQNDSNHPWRQAATYIRAAFTEETDQKVTKTVERAARLLEKAADEDEEQED